ncbi:MAG: M23 family metallopeptidase [Candidatus Thiothrix singaporensis]|uniref:M23 family metallopeptidase n=1 Tax=Candidatus Thiothrix singaporensis TaxID=2799669 RepID=A0A7L6ARQ5_9GAMM|nr:MAG: M23 family metallopeptidase [Candidatus Thiothrix singaporensis]
MYSQLNYVGYIRLLLVTILFFFAHNAIAAVADSFRYPVGAIDGSGWIGNTNGLQWLQQWDYGGKCGYVYHPGVDFNKDGTTGDGDLGQPVYAVANGIVTFSGDGGASWGNIILIEHTLPDGSKVWSQYGHVKAYQLVMELAFQKASK